MYYYIMYCHFSYFKLKCPNVLHILQSDSKHNANDGIRFLSPPYDFEEILDNEYLSEPR